jgi:hypothetical protein
MFMGLVAPPIKEENFDGKILLKQVSKSIKTNRVSYNQQFSDNYHVNYLIQKGEWRDHIMDDDVTLQEIQLLGLKGLNIEEAVSQ